MLGREGACTLITMMTQYRILPQLVLCLTVAHAALGCGDDSEDDDRTVSGDGDGDTKGPGDATAPTIPANYDPDTPFAIDVTASDFADEITHPFFPAKAGATWVFESADGAERIEMRVEAEKRSVWGVEATVIRDTVFDDGEMVEDTWDWYAQNKDGNVWYLGEETYEYEDGEVVCECGAWESGEDGALPGIIMLADPMAGDMYRQEYYAGKAEDLGEVLATDAEVMVPAGAWTDCIKIRDSSAIAEGTGDKYYCAGVGFALEDEDGVRVELIEYSGLD